MTDANSTKVKVMDLMKGEILLKGECPEDVIFFAKNWDPNINGFKIYAKRYKVKGKTKVEISREIEAEIKKRQPHLYPIKPTKRNDVDEINNALVEKKLHGKDIHYHFVDEVMNNKNKDFGVFKVIDPPENDKRIIFKINRPTLLIIGTGASNAKFTPDYVIPAVPSTRLDHNCSGLRLWNDSKILGWYSSYQHDNNRTYPGEYESLYYYNFVISMEFEIINEGETNTTTVTMPNTFDPGNGNGGGNGFP